MMTDVDDHAAQWEETDARELIDLAVTEVQQDGTRADQKAAALLAGVGAITGVVLTAATRGGLPLAATVTLWVSTAPLLARIVRLLLVIRPAYPVTVPFVRYAHHSPRLISQEFRDAAAAPMMARADRLHRLSQAVVRKYRGTRQAVHLLLLGGTGVVTALAVAGLT